MPKLPLTRLARPSASLLLLGVLLLPALPASHVTASSLGVTGDEASKLAASESTDASALADVHKGPGVVQADTGPMRFVPALHDAFDLERVMETVRFADQFYRAPANDGYEAVMRHIEGKLRAAGFGSTEGLELQLIEQELGHEAWTPIGAKLELVLADGTSEVLHELNETGDRDRTMLPQNCPAALVEGEAVTRLDEVIHGKILLTEAPLSASLLRRARMRGASAVVSGSLYPFNEDPTGADRHLDAIQYVKVPAGSKLPMCQISPRTLARLIEEREKTGILNLRFEAKIKFDERKLETIVATIVGSVIPEEAVPVVSHVQEPGACDNASGLAGLLESAIGCASLLKEKKISRPARSVAFVWGDEFKQSEAWLGQAGRTAVAAISSDMTGESLERTGAIALLERMPDPGALIPLEPDFHTPWGAGDVDPETLNPNGFSVIARCAMLDVARYSAGGWSTGDHPWEGGSDHDTFIDTGVPAVLFWHFTDYAYHTSLDRLENVDANEMRRTGTAILATAMSAADPRRGDLKRYVDSVAIELKVRVDAAKAVGDDELVRRWKDWCEGATSWFKGECTRR